MSDDKTLLALMRLIAAGALDDADAVLAGDGSLVTARLEKDGATRERATTFFLEGIGHYVYRGDTALHVAAAGYHVRLAQRLVEMGADVRAQNRRGAEPLHYAADGNPASNRWDPVAQVATIEALVGAGADLAAADRNGATALHRAVRTRCAAAVSALLTAGADADAPNRTGSTPRRLASVTSGRGGSGSPDAKAQQELILRALGEYESVSG